MWTKIDSPEKFALLKQGGIISDNQEKHFKIEKIKDGYITAIHRDGVLDLKILPEESLLSDNWWVKI
ncbi:MAG: hypothetical protein M3O67_10200 [Bacteroidota bacterium]|nr:hypothetical protein [Bacteroidota bacterium]